MKNVFALLFDSIALAFLDIYLYLLGYRACLAKNDQQKQTAYRIRWEVFSDEGFFNKDFERESWTDRYDTHSIIFLVTYGNKSIGTLLLIDNIESGMALNDYFNVKVDKGSYKSHIVEIGRFAIIKKYRERSRLATLALVRAAHNYSLKTTYYCGQVAHRKPY